MLACAVMVSDVLFGSRPAISGVIGVKVVAALTVSELPAAIPLLQAGLTDVAPYTVTPVTVLTSSFVTRSLVPWAILLVAQGSFVCSAQ